MQLTKSRKSLKSMVSLPSFIISLSISLFTHRKCFPENFLSSAKDFFLGFAAEAYSEDETTMVDAIKEKDIPDINIPFLDLGALH